jgi:hypothetical protein
MNYSRKRRIATMINKSFDLSNVKKSKGKIELKFNEITKVSNYIKTESTSLLVSLLESKLIGTSKVENESLESQKGGANE